MSRRIRVLDERVIGKIAAGEVVENPSSVVKELLENSIDAGATVIEVAIERGGKGLIKVVDNGTGINKEDVGNVFLRHATSKLYEEEDLMRLMTLGFRGEALPSIAAVSMVNLYTRTKDSIEGTYYAVDRGRNVNVKDTGCAIGTCIEVLELFYNTPARKEYMKSDSYEASAVNDIVSRMALARPGISFRLINNGRVIINTPGNNSIKDTMASIYGKSIMDNLMQINCSDGGTAISGFVSTPFGTKPNRSYQSFFVNGRYIRSRALSRALEVPYKNLIMVNRYPMAVLHFSIDTKSVDINVHPAKLTVNFKEEDRVKGAVISCVRGGLEKKRWLVQNKGDRAFQTKNRAQRGRVTQDSSEKKALLKNDDNIRTSELSEETVEYNSVEMDSNIENGNKFPNMKVVGQFMCTYILTEGEGCIYLMDQHAAHERVMYEKLIEKMQKGDMASQRLLEPVVMDLGPKELEVVTKNKDYFIALGYELDEFGINSVLVKAVPIFLGKPQSREFIIELINSVFTNNINSPEGIKGDDIIMMACKKAVKANQKLTKDEMENLIKQLSETNMPYTCPHGRPVIVTLTRYELEKMFKRIV